MNMFEGYKASSEIKTLRRIQNKMAYMGYLMLCK